MSPFRSRRRRPSSSYEDWSRGPRRRWRPRSRAGGCLMWVLILIVVLVVLALMFGGFTKGTRSGSAPRFGTSYPVSVFYSG
jgi:ABC-type Fe3+ transport system permease subunit